ncbi:MAG: 3-oxoacyl-ACP reductase [Alphaproteobacteria bacterium]|nr:3-oxoacyl-ACP reductase [Alphaproteobacteria bacterium]|tara:strand:+ start:3342 stop:4094 length:753 start_codon:yes stop_codon:yes gene_type:complete
MDLYLKDRTALVTGASVGIGAGTARSLAEEGVRVAITARRGDQLEQVADKIAADGFTRPVVIVQDIMADDAADNLKKGVDDALGSLDILVNNAGAALPAPVGTDEQIWIDSMNLNWWAVRRVSDQFLPGMIERRWGRIINITGTMEPISINAATCAKAAVQAWSKGLSREHSKDGVTSNCVIPGRIHSEQTQRNYPGEVEEQFAAANIPSGVFGDPEDIGSLVAFIASPRAQQITGSVLYVDGGMKRFSH